LHLLRILTVAEDRNENQKDTKERCGEETDQESYPLVDTEPVWENWITIEKAWIDEAGNHWYKISFVGWVYPSGAGKEEGFSLLRISADGRTSESVMAQYGYPDDITPLGPSYRTMHKQK